MSEVREVVGPSAAACACYISDEGYLFPSLLSAVQARQNVTSQQADVVLYFIGKPTAKSEQFKAAYRSFGIRFVDVDPGVIDNVHIMYARLYLERFVEASYNRIVYIDGDTQVSGDLSPLFDAVLPASMFCAARDPTTIAISYDKSIYPDNATYFSSIGLTPDQLRLYCNSGVLVFDRSSWIDICSDALRLLSTKPTFKFPDQDAINLVTAGRCLTLSFKWNFPIFLMNYGFEDLLKPRIFHFMSNPRPWQGPFRPWGQKGHTPYKKLLEQCPSLNVYVSDLSVAKNVRYHLQQYYKIVVEGPVWRRPALRQQILQIEDNAFV